MKNLRFKRSEFNDLIRNNINTITVASIAFFLVLIICVSTVLFIKAGNLSHDTFLTDSAVSEASDVAESLKATDGDPDAALKLLRDHKGASITDNGFILYYDDSMQPASESTAYYKTVVTITPDDRHNVYSIVVSDLSGGSVIYQLDLKYVTGGGDQ